MRSVHVLSVWALVWGLGALGGCKDSGAGRPGDNPEPEPPASAPAAEAAPAKPPPLYDAAKRGDVAEVKSLLAAGADPNVVNNSRNRLTPLHAAAFGSEQPALAAGFAEIVDALLSKGAAVDPRDNAGRTPLHLACSRGQTDVVRMLLAARANPTLRDERGLTAMDCACFGGHEEIVDLLIKENVDVNAGNFQGTTPLMQAAMNGHLNLVKKLLAEGANLHTRNKRNLDAWDYANLRKHSQVATFLEQRGAGRKSTGIFDIRVDVGDDSVPSLPSIPTPETSSNKTTAPGSD